MHKEYHISRISICVMTLIGSFIMFINEDITLRIAGTAFMFLTALIAVFVMSPLSRKEIALGDGIGSKPLRALYYCGLLPAHLIAFVIALIPVGVLANLMHTVDTIGEVFGQALIILIIIVFIFLLLLIPYIQTLIVLLLRSLLGEKEEVRL